MLTRDLDLMEREYEEEIKRKDQEAKDIENAIKQQEEEYMNEEESME